MTKAPGNFPGFLVDGRQVAVGALLRSSGFRSPNSFGISLMPRRRLYWIENETEFDAIRAIVGTDSNFAKNYAPGFLAPPKRSSIFRAVVGVSTKCRFEPRISFIIAIAGA
jgi:hypothetical protein